MNENQRTMLQLRKMPRSTRELPFATWSALPVGQTVFAVYRRDFSY
jgi:hypothetical protein